MSERDASPSTLRLFIAVELPDEVKRSLDDAIEMLRRAGADRGLRWVRREGIHVTLKFLGAVPEAKVAEIVDALGHAVLTCGVAPFELQPAGFGAFYGGRHMPHEFRGSRHPRRDNLRVVWVGMRGETEALKELAAGVEMAIAPLGYRTEKRPLAAHLTLARVRDDADRPTREALYSILVPHFSGAIRSGESRPELVPEFPRFRVDRVSLMQSTLQRGGAVYRAIEMFALPSGGASS